MNSRQRFAAYLNNESVDHVPDFEFWYWGATLERWADEGLPDHLVPSRRSKSSATANETFRDDLAAFFGFEFIHGIPVKSRFVREPAEKKIAEDDDTVTVRTEIGEEVVKFKPGKGESIPTHISYAVSNREDWERVRDEFMPLSLEGRVPENWDDLKHEYAERDYILNTPAMGYYGWTRNLMGVEQVSISIALEPDLVEEIMEHQHRLHLLIAEFLFAEGVTPDISGWWEDMCYSNGPLISPAMFEQYMVPRYKEVTDFYRAHGVPHAILDSDGNIHKLAPLWLAGGIDILFPCEAAHTDTLKLRQENPPELFFRGGVDKRALARGREAIDAELERIGQVMDAGPLMPHVDHLVPPDVPFADYMYYREKKMKLLGK